MKMKFYIFSSKFALFICSKANILLLQMFALTFCLKQTFKNLNIRMVTV